MDQLLSSLNLYMIDSDYVTQLWTDGFLSDEPNLSDEYCLYLQTIHLKRILTSLGHELLSNVSNGTIDNWKSLLEADFDLKRILCVLHYLFCCGFSGRDEERLSFALAGVRFYFSMLAVPDCHVYSVFQCNLYEKAMRLMTLPVLQTLHSPPSHTPKGRTSCEDGNELPNYSSSEAKSLRKSVCDALKELTNSLQVGNFCRDQSALELTAEMLSTLAQYETNSISFSGWKPGTSKGRERNVSSEAFYGMSLICDLRFGDVVEISRLVMKCVFDMMQKSFQREYSTREGNTLRENTCNFVHYMVNQLGSNCYQAVLILLQCLCTHCPERAEPRYRLVDNVFSLVMKFNEELFFKSVILLIDLSYREKSVSLRHFTVAMVGRLLLMKKEEFYDHLKMFIIEKNVPDLPSNLHKICFVALISRVQDLSALVTAKCLTIFAHYLGSGPENRTIKENLQTLFISPYQNAERIEAVPYKSLKHMKEVLEVFKKRYVLDSDVMPCGHSILKELLDCVSDDKVFVRKAALQCIIRIFRLNEKFMSQQVLKTVSCHCRDNGVVVRKMMVEEFTDLLLSYPAHEQLLREWCFNILPLIVDPEPKVVDKVAENIGRAVFENLEEESSTRNSRQCLPWLLMSVIPNLQLKKFFLKACYKLDKSVLRPRRLISILKSHIGMTKIYNSSAWTMLMCIAEIVPIEDPMFVLDFYHNEIHNQNVSLFLSLLVMEVLWLSWKQLPLEERKTLEEELHMDLILFKMPVPLISRAIDIRHGLYKEHDSITDDSKILSILPEWAMDLIKKCEESIEDMLRASREYVQDEEVMQRFVCSLGNAALLCPGVIQTSTIRQLQSMLVSSEETHESLWNGSCSTAIKAGVVITLGKLSLQSEMRARDLVNILGILLKETDESMLKNNIMVCLADLCIRYASLVESLLPEMCVCLKDSQRSVRENSLVLMIQLLQEDYLKMRERLMFNLLTMLNDDDVTIHAITRTFFTDCVLQKNRKFFCSHFTHAIFHYNGYKAHHQFSKITLSKQEEKAFNLRGPNNVKQRQEIYRFILSLLGEESRIIISQLLCIDVCKGVVEDSISLNESGQGVLKDALFVMSCEEMRHADKKDIDEDAEDMENQINTVRKEVFSEMRKKHVTEIEVPTLASLYQKLEATSSHLAKDVIRNLKFLVIEEKLDLKEILKGTDRRLLKELQLDSRRSDHCDSSGNDSDSSSSELILSS